MLLADRIVQQRLLRARRALAAWLSEHGEEDDRTAQLVSVLDGIDAALNSFERTPHVA